jgi:hypothetical protein
MHCLQQNHYIIKLASRWSAHCLKQNHYIIKLASKWSAFARFSLQLITETIHCLLLHKLLFLLLKLARIPPKINVTDNALPTKRAKQK